MGPAFILESMAPVATRSRSAVARPDTTTGGDPVTSAPPEGHIPISDFLAYQNRMEQRLRLLEDQDRQNEATPQQQSHPTDKGKRPAGEGPASRTTESPPYSSESSSEPTSQNPKRVRRPPSPPPREPPSRNLAWEDSTPAPRSREAHPGDTQARLEQLLGRIQGVGFRTTSPMSDEILNCELPKRFRIPSLESYDGSKDPIDYLSYYMDNLAVHNLAETHLAKIFPTVLRGSARAWFRQLPPRSVNSFQQLAELVAAKFASSKKLRKTPQSLLSIRQNRDESLRKYVHRFNNALLEVEALDQAVAVAAFINSLRDGEFSYDLDKTPPRDFHEVLVRAEMFINAEEARLQRVKGSDPFAEAPAKRDPGLGKKRGHEKKAPRRGSLRPEEEPRAFSQPLRKILLAIKDQDAGKFLRKPPKSSRTELRGDQSKYCFYHKAKGHDTEDCRVLARELQVLAGKGLLNDFIEQHCQPPPRPSRRDEPEGDGGNARIVGTVHVISGGTATGQTAAARKSYARCASSSVPARKNH